MNVKSDRPPREDEVLRRMLGTPPQPHAAPKAKKKPAKPRKK